MAIDLELRKTGIGASEVAAVLGLNPWQTPFDVYARKLDLIEQPKSTVAQRRGKYFERGVVDWYSDLTGITTEWFDKTIVHPSRRFQLASPDAWIIENGLRVAEVQAKTVNWRSVDEYGASGTDDLPVYVTLQCQWTMSAASTGYGDVAALCGMDELRTYRVHRDPEIECVLLEEVERFWKDHVLARVPPAIGASALATEYLKQKFPRNIEPLRVTTDAEHLLIQQLKTADEEWDVVNKNCIALENAIKLAIGNAEGLLDGKNKVTYRRSKDQLGTDWEAIAIDMMREVAERSVPADRVPEVFASIKREQIGKHGITLKEGSRRLLKTWGKERSSR